MSWEELGPLLADVAGVENGRLAAVARYLHKTLERDKDSLLEDARIARESACPSDVVKELLVALEGRGYVRHVFLWQCARGRGAAAEESDIRAFPLSLDCDRCGESHEFDVDHVEVAFTASDALLRLVNR